MIVHESRVRINTKILSEVIKKAKESYDEIGSRETSAGRSRFTVFNNINKFSERLPLVSGAEELSDSYIISVRGESKGATARVYYTPSVTSLPMSFRNSVVPIKDDNIFVFFDFKSAEFFMNCVFCQEVEAVNAYLRGDDIYMHYANLFPEGTKRDVIKTILIANMYGTTPYTVAKQLGCSDAYAENLLARISRSLPRMTMQKAKVIAYARKHNAYFSPRGFNQSELVKVAEVDPKKGFSPFMALSAYVQSALGFFMQEFIHDLTPRTRGTILSIFDAAVVEINPNSLDRFMSWVSKRISPFRVSGFGVGKTFLQAKVNSEK